MSSAAPRPRWNRSRALGTKIHRAFFLMAALVASSCQTPSDNGVSPGDAATIVSLENVAIVKQQTLQVGPMLLGSLERAREVSLLAEISGTAAEVRGEVGQRVELGQRLAEIAPSELGETLDAAREAVLAAEHDLAVARSEYETTRHLVGAGALPQRELDARQNAVTGARARVEDARARLAQARMQVGHATIRAPFAGVISARSVSKGHVVTRGAPLFTIIDPSSMRLEAKVPAQDLSALRIGTPVTFEVREYPGQPFQGAIESISASADRTTGQIPVLVVIANPQGTLVPGLFAEGRVSTERHERLVVPLTAIDEQAGGAFVARVRGGHVERVPVELGSRDPQREVVEVRGPLAPGDRVLTGAARTLGPIIRLSRP